MRIADSGEFYTPRPVVRFIVQVMEPKLGETIFDPACGTGGFLVEAYEYLKKNCSAQDWQILQKSIIGAEAKSLPLMLAHMSLLLHGFEYPDIDDGNSLRFTLSEMGEKDWVDVILTNPPFGGEEEDRIQKNFPPDRKTKETALLFLQLIMRRLRQRPKPGRAAVVFPNGVSLPFHEAAVVHFPKHECDACPIRSQCTTSKHGRSISIHPDESLLAELRERQTTVAGRAKLRERVSVEHTLAHIGQWQGDQARYIGLRKNLFDLRRMAVVHNLHVLARMSEANAREIFKFTPSSSA